MKFELFLPLLTYPTPTPTEGLSRAISLAATLGGRLTANAHIVDIAPITNPLAAPFYDYASVVGAVEAGSKKAASELTLSARQLAAQLQQPLVTKTFRSRAELAAEHLINAARSYDFALTVIDRESNVHRDTAEALLFGSGGPVILIPGSGVSGSLEKVAIAWDGGRAAARAVRDALPILRIARRVTILTAANDKAIAPTSVEAIADFLFAHDIDIEHKDIRAAEQSTGDLLQKNALAEDAALLVMGAYGHNRLREFVLGGATRGILANTMMPILMSH